MLASTDVSFGLANGGFGGSGWQRNDSVILCFNIPRVFTLISIHTVQQVTHVILQWHILRHTGFGCSQPLSPSHKRLHENLSLLPILELTYKLFCLNELFDDNELKIV